MESQSCRLCMSEDNGNHLNIFTSYSKDIKMSEIISDHFKCDVSEFDCYPNFVCSTCWTATENFHELFLKSKLVQDSFLKLLEKSVKSDEQSCDDQDSLTIGETTLESGVVKSEPEMDFSQNSEIDVHSEDVSANDILTSYDDGDSRMLSTSNEALNDEPEQEPELIVNHIMNKSSIQKEEQTPKKTESSVDRKKAAFEKLFDENKYRFDMSCDKCDVVLESIHDARNHYKNIHKVKNGYIKCCGVKLRLLFMIEDHIVSHLTPTTFRCEKCNKNFVGRKSLYKHSLRHKKMLECDHCGADGFVTKESILRHLFSNHVTSEPKFECKLGHKKFHALWVLESHQKKVHEEKKKLATCDQCGRSFYSKNHLMRHMRSHADKSDRITQRFQCEHCGEWLRSQGGIYYHKQMHTSGVSKCDQCQLELPHRVALLEHIRQHHRVPKFKCRFCDKSFNTKSKCKKHEESHTRHLSYDCKYCPKTFQIDKSLRTHMRRHHPLEREKERRMRKNIL